MIYSHSNYVWKTTITGIINIFIVKNKSEAEYFIYSLKLPSDNDSERGKDKAERHDSDLSGSIISAFRTKHGVTLTNELKLFVRALRCLSFSN
jgi:hypothetical protein